MAIEQVVEQPAVGVERAAVHYVAAGDADRGPIDAGTVLPPERIPFFGEIEGVDHIGIRCHHVHGVADHERLSFMSSEHAGGEAPHRTQALGVAGGDLRQAAESG